MADEVRRSGRATKGQHTKNDTPEPSTAKKGKGRGKKTQKQESEEPEEEEAIIRCICGYTVEDKRDKRAMVCCDSCEAWQHNVHMGLSEDDDDLPDQYFCEQCKPEDHKELLDAIARGEKLWEQREQEVKAQKAASRKRGKGGRKSMVADKEMAIESADNSTRAPSQEQKAETITIGQKRKQPAYAPTPSSDTPDLNTKKARKISTSEGTKVRTNSHSTPAKGDAKQQQQQQQQGMPLQMELVEKMEELRDSNRRKAAMALGKMFESGGRAAVEAGTFKVPVGSELQSFAQKLALNVEYAMFMLLWGRDETPKPEYGMQMRQILHNVKHNDDLRDRLLNGILSPNELCMMSSTDMASKELLEKTAEMKKKVEQQSILVKDQEPLIRRTHKGEEIIEGADQGLDSQSASTFRRPKRINTEDEEFKDAMEDDDAIPGSPNAVELPPDVSKPRSPADISKLTIDTRRRSSQSGRKMSASFDVDKVWSSVESPGTPARPTSTHHRTGSNANARADPEIDRLLKEENEDEEEYSPADYSDPDIIWGGGIVMATVTEFRATAKYAAGANLSRAYPWTQLMPDLLSIEGRIDINDANAYLCGLQYSKTNDVTVVSVTPADHQDDKTAFDKLYLYLKNRQRYGVIRESPVVQAQDIYVIPLEAGSDQPEFLELLADNALPASRESRMLLIAYVIKCTPKMEPSDASAGVVANGQTHTTFVGSPANAPQQNAFYRTPSAPNSHMSPIAAPNVSQSQLSGQAGIPANPYASPPAQQTGFVASQPHPPPGGIPQNPYATQSGSVSINKNNQSANTSVANSGSGGGGGLTGMAAAIHILGDMANSPAISQLLVHSPNVGINELGHVKDVFIEAPEARSSLEALLPRLQRKIPSLPGRT